MKPLPTNMMKSLSGKLISISSGPFDMLVHKRIYVASSYNGKIAKNIVTTPPTDFRLFNLKWNFYVCVKIRICLEYPKPYCAWYLWISNDHVETPFWLSSLKFFRLFQLCKKSKATLDLPQYEVKWLFFQWHW